MNISIGFDHKGFLLKKQIIECLEEMNIDYIDRGTFSDESVDYPDYSAMVTDDIINGKADYGILVCNTGIGMSIAANKVKDIRAAYVINESTAESSRKHNNANVLVMGLITVDREALCSIIQKFITADFEGGRHKRRIEKIC